MKLDIPQVKTIIYPVRFEANTFAQIKKIAKENKTSAGKVIRILIEKGMMA